MRYGTGKSFSSPKKEGNVLINSKMAGKRLCGKESAVSISRSAVKSVFFVI